MKESRFVATYFVLAEIERLNHLVSTCEHRVTVNLLVSKSRLVPSKSFTIPRLELLSCLLLSDLLNSVLQAVMEDVNVTSTYCWSNSMIALWWIKQNHKRWSAWVQKRVGVIRSSTPSNIWFHVPSSSNSADISTRSGSLIHLDLSHWFMSPYIFTKSNLLTIKRHIFAIRREGH